MSKTARLVHRAVSHAGGPVVDLPAFLCPGVLRFAAGKPQKAWQERPWHCQNWRLHSTATTSFPRETKPMSKVTLDTLPQQCAGCGAFSQTVNKEGPGYFTLTRKSIEKYVESTTENSGAKLSEEEAIVQKALANAGALGLDIESGTFEQTVKNVEPPLCDRCHALKHHETGVSIHHPSIKSIQSTIFESPHKYNHVYHIIDAADFPMSLVRGLHKILHLTPQRARNRRSKTGKFYHGRKTDVSFIITRSDLLAPLKTQVDSMMPYLRATLRDVLGRSNRNARLGNIKCVSAKRAWWTKDLKEDIWKRGGAGWMVGKVNVGKSQLFHEVFPKGRRDKSKKVAKKLSGPDPLIEQQLKVQDDELERKLRETLLPNQPVDAKASESEVCEYEAPEDVAPVEQPLSDALDALKSAETLAYEAEIDAEDAAQGITDSLDSMSLLPPAQTEMDYPPMPLVSSLPGTTASPIRLSFGTVKAELIDLPGLARGDIEQYVAPEHRPCLIMKSRVTPEQQIIKPGQSLLLGGLVRLTPTTPDMLVMMYPFTSIDHPHTTSTEKAVGIQTKTRESTIRNILAPGAESTIRSAGVFPLKWDVTKQRAGPITRKDAANIKPEDLPYRILATDILIEGCGWVEIVAQVSKRRLAEMSAGSYQQQTDWNFAATDVEKEDDDSAWPRVEVFTPEGKFIDTRRPMNAWMYIANHSKATALQGRPRRSMKGFKKVEKTRRRAVRMEA